MLSAAYKGRASPGSESSAAGEAAVLPLHSVPLEVVWPVQRTDMPFVAASRTPAFDPAAVAAPLAADADRAATLMRELPVAQPTDAAVEVIAPRRPRPTNAPVSGQPGATSDATLAAAPEDTAVLPVQREEESFGAPAAALRSQQAVSASSHGDETMVATDIGLLPSDLWQLLGQQPPGEPTVGTESPEIGSPALGDAAVGARRPAAPAGLIQLAPSLVQRQVDTPPTGSVAPAEVDATGSGHPESTAAMDTGELARRVYAEIRRRLDVEWERTRRP